jgi:hypothetical protein
MAIGELHIAGEQRRRLEGLVGKRAIALVARVFRLTDMETMRAGAGDFWLCYVEPGPNPMPGRFFRFGGELMSGEGFTDAPQFRFEEAEAPGDVPAALDTSLGFPRMLGDHSELSLHDEIQRITIYEEAWDEEGLRVTRDCGVRLDFSAGRSLVVLVDDSSGPTITVAFTPKGIASLTRYLTVRTVVG